MAGSLTSTWTWVPGANWLVQPSLRRMLRPTAAASYSDSALTSTECRTPVGPTKLTVHARSATTHNCNACGEHKVKPTVGLAE